jgi:hypothetical protein
MSQRDTDLALSAVLRRNAHELRNKLSALISAVDVMNTIGTSDPVMFAEALDLLTESGTDLRALADGWTRSALSMFEQDRCEIDGAGLAAAVAAGAGIPVDAGDAASLMVRVDPRIVSAVSARIAELTGPKSIAVAALTRHNLPFVAVTFETTAAAAAGVGGRELIRAMLDQLSAHPRIEGDALVLQLPARRAAIRAA